MFNLEICFDVVISMQTRVHRSNAHMLPIQRRSIARIINSQLHCVQDIWRVWRAVRKIWLIITVMKIPVKLWHIRKLRAHFREFCRELYDVQSDYSKYNPASIYQLNNQSKCNFFCVYLTLLLWDCTTEMRKPAVSIEKRYHKYL